MKRALYSPPEYVPIMPLALPEVKEHCAILDDSSHDAVLRGLVKVALVACERYTRRKLCTQQWDVYFDRFDDPLELPFPPVQSVTHVKYLDVDGVLRTLDTSAYELGERDGVNQVRLAYNQSWPAARSHFDAVVVRITCGYGGPDDVPEDLRHGMKLLVEHLFNNPAPVNIGNIVNEIPWTIASLWDGYRITKVKSC